MADGKQVHSLARLTPCSPLKLRISTFIDGIVSVLQDVKVADVVGRGMTVGTLFLISDAPAVVYW